MRRANITFTLLCITMSAQAGELEDVVACIKAAERLAGVTLDVVDARYQSRLFSRCTATWPNAECEVDYGKVYNLKVNGRDIVIDQFVGRETFDLNRQLETETKTAIEDLRTRIGTLEQRQREVTGCLRKDNPNLTKLAGYIRDGIEQASTGEELRLFDSCPEETESVSERQRDTLGEPSNDPNSGQGEGQDHQSSPESGSPEESARSPKPITSPTQAGTAKAWVSANALNSRTCPSTSCGVVGVYRIRDEVTVYEERAGWSRVSEYADAKCANGITPLVTTGKSQCIPSNGIGDGKYARWVSNQHLSPTRPEAAEADSRPTRPRPDDRVDGLLMVNDCKTIVRGRVKDRRSAEFRNVFFVRGRAGAAVVCGEVNARNSFGGYAGFERFVCNGTPELTVFQSEVSDFHNLWNKVCVK